MFGIIGQKKDMTRIANEKGVLIPVTAVYIPELKVVHTKSMEKDQKNAVVLGVPTKKPTKSRPYYMVREFDTDGEALEKGSLVELSVLDEVKEVRLSSVSKGKGFQGVMKRHNFAGGPGSHGSHFHREPGSIGQRAYPGKVMRGKKLPGHMGVDRITLKKRPVVKFDAAARLIYIKGAIPGHRNTYIEISF